MLDERKKYSSMDSPICSAVASGTAQAYEIPICGPICPPAFYARKNEKPVSLTIYRDESGVEVRFHMRSFHLAVLYTIRMPVPACSL